jgi:hypothetical protein
VSFLPSSATLYGGLIDITMSILASPCSGEKAVMSLWDIGGTGRLPEKRFSQTGGSAQATSFEYPKTAYSCETFICPSNAKLLLNSLFHLTFSSFHQLRRPR